LWEHLVLDFFLTHTNPANLYYWRDKSGREIDFIIKGKEKNVHAIECKINPDQFDPKSLLIFRDIYPKGENIILSPNIKTPYRRRQKELILTYYSLTDFKLPV
jgi:predicted AAA+ superfamily ATPase